mmetsp:Transcript_26761/g.56958  ORF Transcript_26761/g.56958 Transcript_26761/m.56958 type:complete len:87 (-) Transcript_26761:2265-2525(-)
MCRLQQTRQAQAKQAQARQAQAKQGTQRFRHTRGTAHHPPWNTRQYAPAVGIQAGPPPLSDGCSAPVCSAPALSTPQSGASAGVCR